MHILYLFKDKTGISHSKKPQIFECHNNSAVRCFHLFQNNPKNLDSLFSFQISLNSWPGRVVQSVGHLTRKSGVLDSIPGLATYFRFSFRFFKKGSCQLLVKVCTRSTG